MYSIFSSKALLLLTVAALSLQVTGARGQFSDPAAGSLSATTIPPARLLQPGDLNRFLMEANSNGPLILQVGSHVMFAQAHIPRAVYAGPGSQPGGLKLLERLVASTPKNGEIVIYCGCCPWNRCPNMGPAYKKLLDLGFKNVKALYLANNFGDDWVARGYKVEKGE